MAARSRSPTKQSQPLPPYPQRGAGGVHRTQFRNKEKSGNLTLRFLSLFLSCLSEIPGQSMQHAATCSRERKQYQCFVRSRRIVFRASQSSRAGGSEAAPSRASTPASTSQGKTERKS